MMRFPLHPIPLHKIIAAVAALLLLVACTPTAQTPPASTLAATAAAAIPTAAAVPSFPPDAFSDLPAEARTATRQGDPRTAAYWAVWNSCAPDNRSETAKANGGRAAGWILMDDLIEDPGIQLGNYTVAACEDGLALLQERTSAGDETSDPLYALAAALLAAELNLNANAETCPIAEEAVVGGHMVLAQAGFNGTGEYAAALSGEAAAAIPRLVALLAGYNRGELCR